MSKTGGVRFLSCHGSLATPGGNRENGEDGSRGAPFIPVPSSSFTAATRSRLLDASSFELLRCR